jgi:uncharacterized membrane protein YfcA
MSGYEVGLLSLGLFMAALLYTSVGHAGASGYIAVMALMGLSPAVMKPTALCLNIIVASMGTWRLYQAGLVRWSLVWPLLLTAIPAAYWGGYTQLSDQLFRLVVGLVLLFAGIKFLLLPKSKHHQQTSDIHLPLLPALLTGAVVGALSGLTGTGGGIFLSPLLLGLGMAGVRQASGITMPFILANSLAGLLGNYRAVQHIPSEMVYFVAAVLLATVLGMRMNINLLPAAVLQRLLGVVLMIAAAKFMFF